MLRVIDELSSHGTEKPASEDINYFRKTNISASIASLVHPELIRCLREKVSGRVVHVFGHGPTLSKLEHFDKPDGHVFASMNLISRHPVIANQIDVYIGGDMFFPTNEYQLSDKCPAAKQWKPCQFVERSAEMKRYVTHIADRACIILQTGSHGRYHKYNGFTDAGVLECLRNSYYPVMNSAHGSITVGANCELSHPTTFALIQLLMNAGCSGIYLYGMDCGESHFYDQGPIRSVHAKVKQTLDKLWFQTQKAYTHVPIVNVNSTALRAIFPTVESNRPCPDIPGCTPDTEPQPCANEGDSF